MFDYHDVYTWNEVFEYYQDLQRSMLYHFHSWECDLWDYDYHEESCIEFWIRKLNEIGEATEFDLSVLNNLIFVENERFLLIRYNQYEVYNGFQWDNFYSECRSLVIDKKKDKLALVPFRKFCNYNENEAYSAEAIAERIADNHGKVEVSNKLDGSMISCRYYDGELLVSTSKMLDRNESILLDNAYKYLETHENYMKMLQNFKDVSFMFEYISLDDPHIVAYNEEDCGLHLIGARSVRTGHEAPYATLVEVAKFYDIKATEVYDMTFEEVLDSIANNEKKPDEAEGFVVNINGFKVKVKYNDFLQIHCIIGDDLKTPKLILNAMIDGTYDDLYSMVPARYQPRVQHIHDVIWKFRKYKKELALHYLSKAPSIEEDRKAFMQWVDDNVPVRYAGLVRCLALGKNYDYFKGFRYYRAVEFVNMCEANIDLEC